MTSNTKEASVIGTQEAGSVCVRVEFQAPWLSAGLEGPEPVPRIPARALASSHPGPVRREGTSSCPPTSGQHGVGGDRAVCPQTGCWPSLSLSTSPEPVAGCR